MARIALVELRSEHDIEGESPRMMAISRWLGGGDFHGILEAISGHTFVSPLALAAWAALGEAYNAREGRAHRFDLFGDRAERLHLLGYDMVWFMSATATIEATYRLADKLRHGGALVVIGGPHAMMSPHEAAGHADALILGDAEGVLPALLADYDRRGKLAPRYEGGHVAPLGALPLPRWDRLPEETRRMHSFVPLETSRGCESACTFCLTPALEGDLRRHRPISEIVDEVRALQDRGVLTSEKVLFLSDANCAADVDYRLGQRDTAYAKRLFEALIPLDIQWAGAADINVADDGDLVEIMARSGCVQLQVGLESLSAENLVALGKMRHDPSRYLQQVERLSRYGISVIGRLAVGFDGDNTATFEEIARFIDAGLDIPQLSILTPLPGTALFSQMKREGRLIHEDWSLYDGTHVVYHPHEMSPHQLEDGYRWLARQTFSYGAILKRALRSATRALVYARPRMTFRARVARVLAPNLALRALARVDRAEALVAPWDPTLAPETARA